MNKRSIGAWGGMLTLGWLGLSVSLTAGAASPFNIFNPSKWFGSDRYDDYYYHDRYWGGPYGYRGYRGYGPWGPGWGGYGPYGYGPWHGYGYGWGAPTYIIPQQSEKTPERIPQ